MRLRPVFHLPEDKQQQIDKIIRLEGWTIFALFTIIVLMYLVMGSSQSMKAAWIEDLLSLVPPVGILVALHARKRAPTETFPYGFLRAPNIAFLASAVALVLLGAYMLYDSSMKLILMEHPTIGMIEMLGHEIWMGWVMIATLIYSALPPVILGHLKLPLAEALHEKALYTDARMNRADWMTALAAVLGIVGIGIGWWWADSVAAAFISFDVLRDGIRNVKQAVADLMDQRPTKVGESTPHPVIDQVSDVLNALPWTQAVAVRLREEGHVFAGEAFVVPVNEDDLVARIEAATRACKATDWRVYDIVITPVASLDTVQSGAHPSGG